MPIKHQLLSSLLLMLLVLGACSNKTEESSAESKEEKKLLDSTSTEIVLDKIPSEIICLTEICVDTLHLLKIDPSAVSADGITQESEFFGEAGAAIPLIGGTFFEPNIEDIYQTNPQLVIGLGGVHDSLRESLGDIPLYIVNPLSYKDSIEFVRVMGSITGRQDLAEAAIKNFEEKIELFKEQASMDITTLVMYGSDVNFGIDTKESVVGSLLAEGVSYPWSTGGDAESHTSGGAQFSLEEVLKQNPDIIFVETFSFDKKGPTLSDQLSESPIWKELKAVRNDEVYEVRTNIWANGRGIGSLSIVLDEVTGIIENGK
ncbi:ABC transporter substrate-binding protein [Sporosarcina sp. FSL K6-6792]|uniref:ABC transporter substrate-binding protein n=1 Tax=Sporosarcina sp. FSL K6-6792 TaxID=2921559 RepID=UPI0030FA1782